MIKRLMIGIITTGVTTSSFGVTPSTFGGWFQTNDVVVSFANKQFPYSLKMSSSQEKNQLGTVAEIKPALDVTGKAFRIFVKSSDWNKTERFVIIIGSDSYDLKNTITLDIKTRLVNPPNNQWVELVVPFSDWGVFGNPDFSKMNIMLWQAFASAGSVVETEVHSMNVVEKPNTLGVVSIAFDDGKQATVVGSNIMKKYGFMGTAFIDPKMLGQDSFMTQKDVDQLSSIGWDIAGHAYLYELYQKTPTEIEQIMSSTAHYLKSRSYKGSNLYSYPNGRITEDILLSTQSNFEFGFNINGWNNTQSYAPSFNINRRSVDKYTTVEQIKQWVRQAKENGEWLIITFHTLDVDNDADENYSPEQFEEVCMYLKNIGIDVKPISDVVNKNKAVITSNSLSNISFFEPTSTQDSKVVFTGGYDFVRDSDSSNQHEFYISAGYEKDGFKASITRGDREFEQDDQQRSFSTTRLNVEKQITEAIRGYLMVGRLSDSDWSPTVTSGSLVYVPSPDWRAEVYASRDIVGSISAMNEKITVNSYGVSLDKKINDQLMITGSVTNQEFSDNADRTIYAGRLIYTLPKDYSNFNIQLKYQQAESDIPDDTTSSYFIVDRESRAMMTVDYASDFDNGWSLYAYGGGGFHKVADESKPAIEYGFKLTKDINDRSKFEVGYRCTKDFGDYDYEYCWGGVSIGVSF